MMTGQRQRMNGKLLELDEMRVLPANPRVKQPGAYNQATPNASAVSLTDCNQYNVWRYHIIAAWGRSLGGLPTPREKTILGTGVTLGSRAGKFLMRGCPAFARRHERFEPT
jgi:hypothetical protein